MANKHREQYKKGIKSRHKSFRSKNKGHREAQIFHSAYRLKQRHGISLNKWIRRDVWRQIQEGTAVMLKKQSCTRIIFEVDIMGHRVPVVYNPQKRHLVTVLPDKEKMDV